MFSEKVIKLLTLKTTSKTVNSFDNCRFQAKKPNRLKKENQFFQPTEKQNGTSCTEMNREKAKAYHELIKLFIIAEISMSESRIFGDNVL